jgi:hypothetical protein
MLKVDDLPPRISPRTRRQFDLAVVAMLARMSSATWAFDHGYIVSAATLLAARFGDLAELQHH